MMPRGLNAAPLRQNAIVLRLRSHVRRCTYIADTRSVPPICWSTPPLNALVYGTRSCEYCEIVRVTVMSPRGKNDSTRLPTIDPPGTSKNRQMVPGYFDVSSAT